MEWVSHNLKSRKMSHLIKIEILQDSVEFLRQSPDPEVLHRIQSDFPESAEITPIADITH